ncbi:hypothetical protein BB560_001364 [Smittium megazygosporum]|uniref:Uncharacterized protein n=1 Tax=Smittium megazygosporum TaxID=133381 RepID=A0A2T9ZI09_9FUNG|nr:hypothetical protein BB560_001364 [Smittium megazygosporum]
MNLFFIFPASIFLLLILLSYIFYVFRKNRLRNADEEAALMPDDQDIPNYQTEQPQPQVIIVTSPVKSSNTDETVKVRLNIDDPSETSEVYDVKGSINYSVVAISNEPSDNLPLIVPQNTDSKPPTQSSDTPRLNSGKFRGSIPSFTKSPDSETAKESETQSISELQSSATSADPNSKDDEINTALFVKLDQLVNPNPVVSIASQDSIQNCANNPNPGLVSDISEKSSDSKPVQSRSKNDSLIDSNSRVNKKDSIKKQSKENIRKGLNKKMSKAGSQSSKPVKPNILCVKCSKSNLDVCPHLSKFGPANSKVAGSRRRTTKLPKKK